MNNHTQTPTNISETSDMDGFVKFLLTVTIAIIPFVFESPISFSILTVYLLIVTLVSRIEFRTLLLSAASYCIIVLIPYFFGLLLNFLINAVADNDIVTFNQTPNEAFIRLFQLFIIWYVSILYFHTTPMKTVIGLLDKLFLPLTWVGVPVKDYLKVVMCIVIDLRESGTEMKNTFLNNARKSLGKEGKIRVNIKGISQIIVSSLVNSFEKIDKIQSFVEKVNPDDLYDYKFKISYKDGVGVLSIVLLISVLWMIEKGHWFWV